MRAAAIVGCVLAMPFVTPAAGRVWPEPDSAAASASRIEIPSAGEVSMRPVMTRRYTMSGKVRPLLFWIGKEDIGLARIVWRRGESGRSGTSSWSVPIPPKRRARSIDGATSPRTSRAETARSSP